MTARAARVRCSRPRAASPSAPTLSPSHGAAREKVRTDAGAAQREPAIKPWPSPPRISPELIAYHKHRAHRLRSRVLRRTLWRAWRRMSCLVQRLVRIS
jgi:hypothetical protein